jgi:transposase
MECGEHKVEQIPLSFAEKNSRYTVIFEAIVLDWLKRSPISAVSKSFHLGWDAIDGIMQRGIQRGLARRKISEPEAIGIDETCSSKGQNYITIILDKEQDCVIDVLEDRKAETLENWFKTQKICDLNGVKSVSMDMWDPFIKAVKACIAGAEQKIGFDRFHVSQHFNRALDKVRAREHREQQKLTGTSPLTKSRFGWLTNSQRTDNRSTKRKAFLRLSRLNLLSARAWRIKEQASRLWDYVYMKVAGEAWKKLLWWISHCRIAGIIQAGKMIRNYFWGILNAIRLRITNSMLEAKNACIQRIKRMACGFRNRKRFKLAIMFHLGNLDMRPSTI